MGANREFYKVKYRSVRCRGMLIDRTATLAAVSLPLRFLFLRSFDTLTAVYSTNM